MDKYASLARKLVIEKKFVKIRSVWSGNAAINNHTNLINALLLLSPNSYAKILAIFRI